jgi:hypothetical protein
MFTFVFYARSSSRCGGEAKRGCERVCRRLPAGSRMPAGLRLRGGADEPSLESLSVQPKEPRVQTPVEAVAANPCKVKTRDEPTDCIDILLGFPGSPSR